MSITIRWVYACDDSVQKKANYTYKFLCNWLEAPEFKWNVWKQLPRDVLWVKFHVYALKCHSRESLQFLKRVQLKQKQIKMQLVLIATHTSFYSALPRIVSK